MDREARPAAPGLLAQPERERPQAAFEPFGTRDQAELFRQLARASSLTGALAYVRNPSNEALMALLGRRPMPGLARTSTAAQAVAGVVGSTLGIGDRYDPRVGVTFAHLWQRWLDSQRHLEETTLGLYGQYGDNHLLPFFREIDLGLVQRAEPLRATDAVPGTLYVDDWVKDMLTKPRRNNVQQPIKGSQLSIKFIRNVHTVLKQVFQFAVDERPALLEVSPARENRLPKEDRREMFFVQDAAAYLALRAAMDAHFRPLLDLLVGTGARFGEAAGLLVRHLHLDAEQPYVAQQLRQRPTHEQGLARATYPAGRFPQWPRQPAHRSAKAGASVVSRMRLSAELSARLKKTLRSRDDTPRRWPV